MGKNKMSYSVKHKVLKQTNTNSGANMVQKCRDNSAMSFLNFCLVDKEFLESKEYDFSIIPDIYVLLYGFDRSMLVDFCENSISGTFELKNYRSNKIEGYFKTGQVSEFTRSIVGNIIPERFKGIDLSTKLKVRKMLLGYYMLKLEHIRPEDLVAKAIYLGLTNCLDKFIYKENLIKKLDFKSYSYSQDKLDKETSLIKNMKIFTEKNKVNYLHDLIPYFNGYIEGYIDLEDINDSIAAVEKVSEDNREVFKKIQNIGYVSLSEEDLDALAKESLSLEVYNQYKKDTVELNEIYYQVVIPISYYISQNELSEMLKEERSTNIEQLNKANEFLKIEVLENKTLKKSVNKLEKEVIDLKLKCDKSENELLKFQSSKCNDEEYQKLLSELEKIKVENLSLTQDVVKWKGKTESSQRRIDVLEERLEDYNTIMSNLVDLQQENILLQESISKVDDLSNDILVEDTDLTYEKMLEVVRDLKILFVGGTSNVGTRLKEIFPNLEFINIADRNLSFVIPESMDCVVIYPRVLTHAHTERIYSLMNENMPLIYVNALNTKLVVQEIYTQILNGHK